MNNAGTTGPFGPIWEVDPEDWWHTLEIHLRGSFLFTNRIVPGMIERGGGCVINMVSGAGIRPNPNFSGYGVAKTAMIRLSETMAIEGKEHGIISFAMSPGLVITELAEHTMRSADAQRWRPEFVERLANEKVADVYDDSLATVTRLALILASGEADALSGQHLNPTDDVAALLKQASS
jgi:NAD(P)-dependent dehydrogenase (short-subunit alcohol dehydrogenase family)